MDDNHEVSAEIKKSKKPIIIIGQSILKLKSVNYVVEKFNEYLEKNNKINNEWNAFNILCNNASAVGSYDLNILSSKEKTNKVLKGIEDKKFKILFLFGQDNINFKKNNEFVVYIGSHGDKGAEISDVILPGAAYTEQNGFFTNLEGKLQKAYKASYPPGEAKEDWSIINELSSKIKSKKLYNNKEELEKSMMNYLKLSNNVKNTDNFEKFEFINEKISLNEIDYYYSNVIARSSKTMSKCRNEKIKLKETGTEG